MIRQRGGLSAGGRTPEVARRIWAPSPLLPRCRDATGKDLEMHGMKTLRSYVLGEWHEAKSGFADLVDPSTEETVARASTQGVDFHAVLAHAREVGSPALRAMTFAERGLLLKNMSKALRDKRDELMEISRINSGTTAADGAFDIDGATGTLHYYANLARGLGDLPLRAEGEG